MDLFTNLGTLETAGLIQVSKLDPDLEYLFRHSMVQDAAYASLLESDRKRLHLAVGNAIEHQYPDRLKELAAILGHHFKEAGEEQRALEYFLTAGDESLAVYANPEAEIQYRRALELDYCSPSDIARLYSGLGEALYRQSCFDESLEVLHMALDIFKSLENYDGVARLYAQVARVEWFQGDRPKSLSSCLVGMQIVKDAPDSLGKATLISETARAYYFNGNSELALPLCRQALDLARQLDATYVQADALATLGILAGIGAQESLEALKKAVELAEENGFLQVAMRAHINLGTMTRAWVADNETALSHFRRAAELGKLRGVSSEEFLGLSSYVSCLFAPGRLDEIAANLPRLEELVRQIDNPAPAATLTFIKVWLAGVRGEWDRSIAVGLEVLEDFRQQKNKESILSLLDQLTWMILEKNRWGEQDDLEGVEILLQEAVQMVEDENMNERIWVYPRMAVLRARQGRMADGREWLEKARQSSSATPSAWDDRLAMESEYEIASAEQDWEKALAELEKLGKAEGRLGFRVASTRSLLFSADVYIKRGAAGDLERAQSILSDVITAFNQMGVGHYQEIAQSRLKVIHLKQQARTLDHAQMTRELRKARQVQESLLPENPPNLPGWDLSVLLEPAHETSGDFYDFLPLADDKLGLVIADVTDKGTSAALFMALSRSLWRTFAAAHPARPDRTIVETNRRILTDTHGGLYITLLYGIIDPVNGTFTYCSAGHHPAFLRHARDGSIQRLESTGIPLGVLKKTSWQRKVVQMEKGDVLVLYTDGITDAQNAAQEFFGLEKLQEAIQHQTGKTAREIRDSLRTEVRAWVGAEPQFDDITLMVVMRLGD